jgi:hypothetical protein
MTEIGATRSGSAGSSGDGASSGSGGAGLGGVAGSSAGNSAGGTAGGSTGGTAGGGAGTSAGGSAGTSAGGSAGTSAGGSAGSSAGGSAGSSAGGSAGSSAGSGGSGVGGYASVVLADGPVAYWRLEEPVGATTVKNEVSSLHTAVASSGTTLGQPGLVKGSSGAARLDGGYLDVLGAEALRFAGGAPFTLEAWIKPSNAGVSAGNARFICVGSALDDTNNGYYMYHVGGALQADRRAGGMNVGAYAANAVVGEAVLHVVVTHDGSVIEIHVNGASVAKSSPSNLSISVVPTGLRWGGRPSEDVTNLFVGTIDELAIYDSALSKVRIQAHYAAGVQ